MISLALWEGKLFGGSYDQYAASRKIGVVSLTKGRHRFCTATAISQYTLITAGYCVFYYEKLNNFGGIKVRCGNSYMDIVHLESHPNYNKTKQYEFDVGLVTVSNFLNFEQFL